MQTPPPTCPDCGAPLPAHSLGGLCPKCLAAALQENLSAANDAEPDIAGDKSVESGISRSATAHFSVEQELARGGMGIVFRATDENIGRPVVLKFLRPERESDVAAIERFFTEARITGRLEHPSIVPVYHVGSDSGGKPFYAMRQIQGETLAAILEKIAQGDADTISRYPLGALLNIFQKICDAVAYAHSRRVIHRDLKPDNVMIGAFGEAVLMDWGLAKALDAAVPDEKEFEENPQLGSTTDFTGTLDNTVMGTPGFMAPEQAGGQSNRADERTDIYSLGAILYAILTLRPPIRGKDTSLMLDRTRTGDIRPPSDFNINAKRRVPAIQLCHCPGQRVPLALSAVAMKALAVDSANRYQSVVELQQEIAAYQGGFATSVEAAGAFRQSLLLVKRHKTISAFSVLVLLLLSAVVAQTLWSNHRMKGTLAQLRATAPAFYEKARALVDDGNLDEALSRIDYALSLMPREASYHELRGNILQTMLRFKEASAAYAEVLKLSPMGHWAATNQALCQKLLSTKTAEGAWSSEALLELQKAMSEQGRAAEALTLAPLLKAEQQKILQYWKQRLEAAGLSTKYLTLGGYGLSLQFKPGDKLRDSDLAALHGMPLTSLHIYQGTNITTLAPLKGMPLQDLNLELTRIHDLTPLRGMTSLRWLGIGFAPVADLTPLKGLRLTGLMANNTVVRDLSPLQGMPLTELTVSSPRVEDIAPLQGMPLQRLDLLGTRVTNIAPLVGMPLKSLRLQELTITDLTPLKGMPLNFLSLFNTKVSDLRPLTGMPLETLELDGKRITDISVLRGMPLKTLHLKSTAVRDFSPLRGLRLNYLTTEASEFSDLRLLEGMPLETLNLRRTWVTDLSAVSSMPTLTQLDLSETSVVDLAPLKSTRLNRLALYNTRITSIAALAGMPLRQLTLHDCPFLRDVSPLANCLELELLTVPTGASNLHLLRNLPRLRSISYKAPNGGNWPDARAFWRAFEARVPAAK